jgi:hypothetical protein
MASWWIPALAFFSGLTLGGMIGALFMAALQINKDPDNDPWLH